MTDLHVHILPGVDDGSPNLSTSLEMAEMAAQSGVRILAVTPHANQTGIEGVEDGSPFPRKSPSTSNTFPSAWCAAWKS